MLRRFLQILVFVVAINSWAFASGELYSMQNTNDEATIISSKYANETKTFKGTVINAGSRYEELDEWIQDKTPYQDVRVRIKEDGQDFIVLVKYQLSYYLGSKIPADELKVRR